MGTPARLCERSDQFGSEFAWAIRAL